MSTKPTEQPEWASGGSAVLVDPTTGKKQAGWVRKEKPAAELLNWWQNLVWKWTQWLDDGDVSFHDLLVTGSTVFTGTASHSSTATMYDIDVTGVETIVIAGASGTPALGGLANGVDGQEVWIINTNSAVAPRITHEDSGETTQANRIKLPGAPGYLILAQNSGVKLRYVGAISRWMPVTITSAPLDVSHLEIPQLMSLDVTGTHNQNQDYTLIIASTNPVNFPISLPYGAQITGYALYVDKLTDNTNTIAARLKSIDGLTGTVTSLGAGSSSAANAPGFIILSESGLSIVVGLNSQYRLEFTPGGGITPANDKLYHLRIDYQRNGV